ncbi:MAG: esterase [Chloroflexi bacterium]|nr:esterase [Chloroflexota bacterium]MCI0576840.1 esterase [Chloroflexota bacterium]MCI0649449.1 esterase [Chloroflexota bacterium]MCI0730751.1 esterase [Chloroflexota bacterium]
MDRHLDGWHSPSLNKYMEIVTYGYYGFPLLLFPTAAADYLEYERFYMIEVIREQIDAGKVKVFSINSINRESWLSPHMHPYHMAIRQMQYNDYICNEVVPYIWHSCQGRIGIITCGASLGAFHAANQLFRRPDLFDGMIAMSGSYDIRGYIRSDYYDDNIYFNNPVDYLPRLEDDYFLSRLRQKQHIHIVSGQGDYENPDASRRLSGILSAKGIPHELDLWGYDMPHDWPTWRSMIRYYLAAKL